MGLVDIEYEVYKCPHCDGYIVIRKQFPSMELGCSTSLEHYRILPSYLIDKKVEGVSRC